jgi:hypothetical protein
MSSGELAVEQASVFELVINLKTAKTLGLKLPRSVPGARASSNPAVKVASIRGILYAVAQVTIYLPDDLEKELRRRAKRAGKSLSALVSDLARAEIRPSRWPEGYGDLFGAWRGSFPLPEDPPPDEVHLEPVARRSRRTRR